ncbi:MAG: hypothetical protein IJW31_06595 [Lentisphaeria bacterium]|nr:hypothetical protein [Lentisphaeria bacterium]
MKKQTMIFMSGYGSNAEALLEFSTKNPEAAFEVVALVTDRPKESRTYEIAEKYRLEVIECDIFEFYRQHGEELINLATPERVKIRELWTAELSRKIKSSGKQIDFILLAGFEPLSNITCEYTSLNVHPGDLTVEIDGERVFSGLGIKPIELAIVMGNSSLRSSVIIAQSFNGKNSDIDAGPILGISEAIAIDLCGIEVDELRAIYSERPPKLPKGYSDKLREIARKNLEKLKYFGDHTVFVQAANDYAKGNFAVDSNNNLLYKNENTFIPIKTVEYFRNGTKKIVREA